MKVLVIDEWLPWPLESGKRIRSFNLLSNLAKNHNILYMAYANPHFEISKFRALEDAGIRVIPVVDTRLKKWTFMYYLSVFMNIFSDKAFSTHYHIRNNFIELFKKTLDDEKPDLIHCEWTNLAPFLEYSGGYPTVLSAHNIESDIWSRWAECARNPLLRLVSMQQAARIEKLEKEWYPRVNGVIAVSRKDQEIIESYGAKAYLVDNGVDLQWYEGGDEECEDNNLVFVASMDTFANQDAVIFFVENVLPRITNVLRNVNFWVVGKDPPKAIRSLSRKNSCVHVTGTVPDVREYLRRATICVVPLRIGGGSRLKILEAMAMRKPVISTTIGAEGLTVTDGENIVITNGADEMANKIIALLSDKDRMIRLGLAGWNLVRSQYDWKMLAKRQNDVWKLIAEGSNS